MGVLAHGSAHAWTNTITNFGKNGQTIVFRNYKLVTLNPFIK